MAALLDIYFKEEVLETLLATVKAKKDKGVAITVSVNDESNEWGQNVSAFVSQSKEDREAKKKKYYVANGKVLWHNDTILKAENKQQPVQEAKVIKNHDLPW